MGSRLPDIYALFHQARVFKSFCPGVWTVYWGPRAIHSCEDCATKLSEWDMTWRPKAEAAAKATHDLWAGPKVVHIFEKGQGGVWGELGELADIPGIQAICGILSPPGPMMLDMTGPKEMAKCPLCPACLQAYADPPGMTPLENHYFGYAIPTTPAPAPPGRTSSTRILSKSPWLR